MVDRDYESSPTGDDSTSDAQRHRMPNANSHSHINGNVYPPQNGTSVRTRRLGHPNNLKVGAPCRRGKQFKKLDKLGVTHEENLPLNSIGSTGNGTSVGLSSTVDINLNTRISGGSLGSSTTGLNSICSKSNIAKALSQRNSSGGQYGTEEQESCMDTKEERETAESHSEHTLSEEEELWMGPWNSLHIPMTKL